MNSPGSTNDRTAWNLARFDHLVANLPFPYVITGDAAYASTEQMMVPYPGTSLSPEHGVFNYYQSQSRVPIEQIFGMWDARDSANGCYMTGCCVVWYCTCHEKMGSKTVRFFRISAAAPT